MAGTFWIGGLLVLAGLIARLTLPPQDERPSGTQAPPRIPLLAVLKSHPRQILMSIGVSYGYNTFTYIATVFLMSYVLQRGYSDSESLQFQLWGCPGQRHLRTSRGDTFRQDRP